MIQHKPVPDWEKSKLFLVDPSIWPFYCPGTRDLRPVYRNLLRALTSLGIDHEVLSREDHPLDIWLRDWGPVEDCYFDYRPSYAKYAYSKAAVRRARAGLTKRLGQSLRSIPLVLDGGNLVHNGRVAILTEKVFWDNPSNSKAHIERMILSLGFEQVVFIPVEPDDTVGHADGVLRFFSPNVLLVNDYNKPAFADYRRRLQKQLKRSSLSSEIVPFPWKCSTEQHDRIWSAVGCYINFILTARGIVHPAFDDPVDQQVASLMSRLTSLRTIAIPATPLARLGGVLHCAVLNR